MQSYEQGVRVHADDGWHDKIEIKAVGWCIQDDLELVDSTNNTAFAQQVFNHLASPRNADRSGSQALVHSLIFNRPRRQRFGTRCKLEVRSEAARLIPNYPVIPAPLFGGELFVSTDRREESGGRCVVGTAYLKLNPTRYARHQSWRENRPRARPHLRPFESLFRYGLPANTNGERSFDGGDNWIPLTENGEHPITPESAALLRCNYFQTVFDCISSEVRRAAEPLNLEATVPPFNLNLRTLETFWEFTFDEPLSLIASFAELAQGFAQMTNRHHTDRVETGTRVLQFAVRNGVTLKVYAKTNRRVRLEVEHDFSKLRGEHAFPRQHGSVAAVENTLEMARARAATTVNEFLAHCDRLTVRPAELRSPVSLILSVVEASQNIETAREILEALCFNGCVMTQSGSPINAAIKKLREASVLQNRPHSRVYRLSARFDFAIARLRTEGRLPMFFNTPFPIVRARPTPRPS